MLGAWRASPVVVRDCVLAVTVALVTLGRPLLGGPADALTPQWVLPVVAACAPLAVRRLRPLTAALASGAVVLVTAVLGQPQAATWVAVVAFGSAAYHHRRPAPPAVAAACWLIALDLTVGFGDVSRLPASLTSGLTLVAAGYALRFHRDWVRQVALTGRAEERARIAREVHDVVGHHLSAIRLRAVGARRAGPEEAVRALDAIAEISGTALGETRRLLGLLRAGDDGGSGAVQEHDLGALVGRLSRQGLDVRLDGDRSPEWMTPQVRHEVYRIVQEALTNVVRHAGASRARVRVVREEGVVVVVVEDDGRASPGGRFVRAGGGIRGMRERVALLGGTFMAGPRDPHGWRVTARLPLGGDRAGGGVRRKEMFGERPGDRRG